MKTEINKQTERSFASVTVDRQFTVLRLLFVNLPINILVPYGSNY